FSPPPTPAFAGFTFLCCPAACMLCSPRCLRSRLGPGAETYTNLSSGVEPWPFQANAATIFTIAKNRSHADSRARTRQGKDGLNCRVASALSYRDRVSGSYNHPQGGRTLTSGSSPETPTLPRGL